MVLLPAGLRGDGEETPLQLKLNALAELIAKLGSAAGLLLFSALMIRFFVQLGTDSNRYVILFALVSKFALFTKIQRLVPPRQNFEREGPEFHSDPHHQCYCCCCCCPGGFTPRRDARSRLRHSSYVEAESSRPCSRILRNDGFRYWSVLPLSLRRLMSSDWVTLGFQ